MREYRSEAIRNIAVVGHGSSGKTTLVDALAFVSGTSKRHGTIRDGTTLTDSSPEETERKYSISLGCAFAEWKETKINLLDTPGFLDFQGDAIAGIAAADGALIAVGASTGVEAGTERMFREAIERKDPVLFVIATIDREHADFDAAYRSIKERLTAKVVPVEIPIGSGASFKGVINLFTKRAHLFKPGTKAGEYEEADIPASEQARFERYHQEMVEAVAATDDALLERFFGGEELPGDLEMAAMKEAMKRQDIFPLLCCSSQLTWGVRTVLDFLVALMPSAFEMEELHAFKGAEGERTVEIHPSEGAPFTALVFKTTAEPHVGDVSYFRTFSGVVAAGQEVYNATRDTAEKLMHLSVPNGRDRMEVPRLYPGDIGCVAKLHNTHTNDTLSTKSHPVRMPQIHFPDPVVTFAVRAASRTDEEKFQQGLHRLHDEDPTFQTHFNSETHETIVGGMGERHIEVALARVGRQLGVKGELSAPGFPIVRPSRRRPMARDGTKNSQAARDSSAIAGSACGPRRAGRDMCSRMRSSAVRFRAGSFRRSIAACRKRRHAECSRAIRWWISSLSATTGATTRSTRTKRRSRWPAFSRSRRSRRSAARHCSNRSKWSRSPRPTHTSGMSWAI